MLKKIMAVFGVVLVFLSLCVPTAAAASIRSKKVVSVLYDDSGSMHLEQSPKWAYANYAMQSFTGMLNKEDTLFINYMSRSSAEKIDLLNKNAEVKKIREKSDSGGTPIDSVEMAFNKLENYTDKNPNTQYWLVIMTDGEFYKNQDAVPLSQVEEQLTDIAETKMPNGTKPKVVFLSMCDTSGKFTPSETLHSNISVETAEKAEDIMATISRIADRVSGRYATNDIKVIDSKTIEVKSDIPLLSIGVLTQNSTATVKNVDFAGESKGKIESNVGLKYPQVQGRVTDESLRGNVALLSNGDKNIPSGKYKITFSEDIDKNKIKILCEPAIELKIKLFYGNGDEMTNPPKVLIDSEFSATAKLYEMGTDNEIDMALLPADFTRKFSCYNEGKEIASTEEEALTNIKTKKGSTVVEAEINVDGFFQLQHKIEFTPYEIKIKDIKAEKFYDGSLRKDGDGEDVVYTNKLKGNRTGVLFTLYTEAGPIDSEIAKSIASEFKDNVETKISPIDIEIRDDGKILVYPTKPVIHSNIIYWLRFHGEQTITGSYDGVSASETIIIKTDLWPIIIEIWILIIIIRIIITWLFRKTFGKLKITHQHGRCDSKYDNIFSGEAKVSVPLSQPSAVYTLLKIIMPIPVLPTILLLKPGKKNICDGLKAVPIQQKRHGTSFKLVGLKGRAYVKNECINKISLPGSVGRNDNTDNSDSIILSSGSVVTIDLGGKQYVKIKVEKL